MPPAAIRSISALGTLLTHACQLRTAATSLKPQLSAHRTADGLESDEAMAWLAIPMQVS